MNEWALKNGKECSGQANNMLNALTNQGRKITFAHQTDGIKPFDKI